MIVCEPEITCFKIQDNFDFLVVCCDGIFEQLNNRQVVDTIWDRIAEQCQSRQIDMLTPQ